MADRFIRDETLSGMANTIRKITNTDVPINFEKFAKGEVAESFYEGEYEVSGEPIAYPYYDGSYILTDSEGIN